ncbi:MAG: chemotaxis response regulator protein-glutamate methylesterase [Bacteroidetes bacterium]|jgi:two-component system, chemotaxis family, protein-glutamate methylesterase/glutaminase|nr:chemotaxis response regulator protein-glutamate methylesterase [Bacteroidota bacterium]MBT3750629.1 chemotaxis response regulator protein-glutamate methylesterase [Bacteroidota bacterium]MBT4400630.1 chemotaxis response regulator protein-glutamate methylesterase [Bacteroidota bacterium]MBT4408382.1 chemotaxis response regulator protein-glutamate methylesterase [Bacteroidota bacterium]MBT7464063.1 chemotaxis response regulator protein-glutamate methylesterase [Bacteroidota bacterium]
MTNKKVSALIVDDSPLVREVLSDIISSDDELKLVGTACDPFEAVQIIQKSVPDVITLDIEMPKMDGITFLKKIMSQHPIPVIVLSSHTASNKQLALKAFENGALYVMNKPEVEDKKSFLEYSGRLCELIKMAGNQSGFQKSNLKIKKTHSETEINTNLSRLQQLVKTRPELIAIGASAGGTMAIQSILTKLKGKTPPIVITQHMPVGFTKEFALRLNRLSGLEVCESEGNEFLQAGHVYIAPGDKHLRVIRQGGKLKTEIFDGDLVNHHKPAVDVMFESVATSCKSTSIAFLLTGMGRDGAQGLLSIKKHGGFTLAQDKKTSVVYGMPAEAMRIGAAFEEIPLDHIGPLITKFIN